MLSVCMLRKRNPLPPGIPTLLVDPVRGRVQLLDFFGDLLLFAEIRLLVVIGVFVDVDHAGRQGTLLLLGDVGAPSVFVEAVLAIQNLCLPVLFLPTAYLLDVAFVQHLQYTRVAVGMWKVVSASLLRFTVTELRQLVSAALLV